jgi:2-C-methyl-D-erythritol 4-phosphate cytidylyltransferase
MISALLLSGGLGKRMQTSEPKQYIPLHGKPIILHALEALLQYPYFSEIALVCEEKYKALFASYECKAKIVFALPGKERQDSVFSGLCKLSPSTKHVCIHDGARPLLLEKDLLAVIAEGQKSGAAALATQVKTTIKETNKSLRVQKTLDRSRLFEIQTPQVISYSLLKEGHQKAAALGKVLTDDVSNAELLHHPVQLVLGSESNIKITTSEDLLLAEILLRRLHG